MTATKDKPMEGDLNDFNAVLYDVFHSMSQPSMQGKTWGELLEYAKTHLTPILIRAAEENAALRARVRELEGALKNARVSLGTQGDVI